MRIYVSHARVGDYQGELYAPLRASRGLGEHELILPHEDPAKHVDALALIPHCDLVLAEVSHPSTGQGIELGWATAKGVRSIAIAWEGATVSASLRAVAPAVLRYASPETLSACVLEALASLPGPTEPGEHAIPVEQLTRAQLERALGAFQIGQVQRWWVLDRERLIVATTRGYYGVLAVRPLALGSGPADVETVLRLRFDAPDGVLQTVDAHPKSDVPIPVPGIPVVHRFDTYFYCLALEP